MPLAINALGAVATGVVLIVVSISKFALGAWMILVLIPLLIYYWGKGAYCGWICSCGAMAETFGDQHRHKMPHGPFWNRLNLAGQAILAFAVFLLILRIAGWMGVARADHLFHWLKGEVPVAFVVLRPDVAADAEALADHCRTQLASFKVPREIRFVDALPRNAMGKVEKKRLI